VLYQLSYGPIHGQGRSRTADTTIFSRVLYQLSYLASSASFPARPAGLPKPGQAAKSRRREPSYLAARLFDEKPAPANRTRAGGPSSGLANSGGGI
jgi:hypothetical protein